MFFVTGNSKALIEEEKFRKNGKKKYEILSEKMINQHNVLTTLTSSPLIVNIELSSILQTLSHQAASIVRSSNNHKAQERVELMHLHTMTHGTRRWSGGGNEPERIETSPVYLPNETDTDFVDAVVLPSAPITAPTSHISPMLNVQVSLPSKTAKTSVNVSSVASPRAPAVNHSKLPNKVQVFTTTVAGKSIRTGSTHFIGDENIRKNV
jgi:hypothetical protein